MPGPLPEKNRRRRNAPTIPTTNLPASGRVGRSPRCPLALGKAGRAWWRWAWKLPQAVAWSDGDHYAIARRARLEDDVEALEFVGLDIDQLPASDDEGLRTYLEHVERLLRTLKRVAGGKLAVEREMRELDDRLGLTPKGIAALRWTIVEDQPAEAPVDEDAAQVTRLEDRRRRLVDAS
jgi:hypothetical protein